MNYDSPLFIDVVLFTIYALLLLAVALTAWSVGRSLWHHGEAKPKNAVPARRIALFTALLLAATLAVTWLLASTRPLTINGRPYTDVFWLRTSDMLIATAAVLLVVLGLVSLLSFLRNHTLHHDHV